MTILFIIAIYFYCQNRYLIKNINLEKETENKKESFVATLVHDLKTPTNAQLNTLSMLQDEIFGALNTQQQEMIALTQESCKYMSNLIGTIMETYNCDSGEIHLQKSHFNITELIIELCEETKVLYETNNQKLHFYDERHNSIIYADKLQIKRVILNLLSNAINYSFANTTIEIILTGDKNCFEIYIKNTSKPISENELSTIFDKYKKTEYSHYNKIGNGLGLYLSKKIVELHNGKIYAKSEKDGTCIFGFIIPTRTALNKELNSINKT